jgi:FMN phosphatase YigB (HAD superfamily)
MPGTRAIFFDWGDTLIHYPGFDNDPEGHTAAVERLFLWMRANVKRQCFNRIGMEWPAFQGAYNAIAAEHWAEIADTNRDQSFAERLVGALRRSGCVCHMEADMEAALVGSYLDEMTAGCWPIQGGAEVVPALARDYPLAVVANFPVPEIVHLTLERHGLKEYFEQIVVSGTVGRMKPDPLPFKVALKALGVAPQDVLFVGDSLRNDMRGAKALGCRTAWLSGDPGALTPTDGSVDLRLGSLTELLGVFGNGASPP